MKNKNSKVWLIGSGPMAIAYANVLKSLKADFQVIGRGENSAKSFEEKTAIKVKTGGLENWLKTKPEIPGSAIIAVSVEQLSKTTIQLLNYGIKKVLVEKPAGVDFKEIKKIGKIAKQKKSKIVIAYNRRCFSSTLKAEDIIKTDGGVKSVNFEFTEWSHVIEKISKPDIVKENWLLANSTHVIDLAFYFAGVPKKLESFISGKLKWHPVARFVGAGITNKKVLFSYSADWKAPGRWRVELLTEKHRIYLSPMEEVKIQKIGSIQIDNIEIDNKLDKEFKPGVFIQTDLFLNKINDKRLCTLENHLEMINWYKKIIKGKS